MVHTNVRATCIPAYRAAEGLIPTVRISNPSVVLSSSQATRTTAARAMRRPAQARGRAKEVRQGGGRQNGRGTIHAGGRVTQHLLDEVIYQFYGNVVHHDRIDDLVGTESGFEDTRNGPPQGPAERTQLAPAADAPRWAARQPHSQPPPHRVPHVELPLSPDIEHTTSES